MISAVVTNYNNRATIERCLNSLRDQELKIDEIILVDGGSTDGSLEIGRSLADRTFTNLAGIGKARVYGIKQARNNLILSCDGDSRYPHTSSSVAKEILEKYPSGTGPIYPIEDSYLGRLESHLNSTIPIKPWTYEMNTILRKNIFTRRWLDLIPYGLFKRADIGSYVALNMSPKFDSRLYCWTKLPTTYFQMLGTGIDLFRIAYSNLMERPEMRSNGKS